MHLNKQILRAQKQEKFGYLIYLKLAKTLKNSEDQAVIKTMAEKEEGHYQFFKKITKKEVKTPILRIWLYYFATKILGLNFGLRLMEKTEGDMKNLLHNLKKDHPEVAQIITDEEEHEHQILDLINKEELKYIGSIILGLNDALVELTGALAGLTLALQNTKIIAIAGAITGFAAALSMAGSEYLSTKEEENIGKNALKASIYTGITYLIAVIILILPYLTLKNSMTALLISISFTLTIIFIFTFYISVAKNISFKKKFREMALISLGVIILNFFIGIAIRKYIGVEI